MIKNNYYVLSAESLDIPIRFNYKHRVLTRTADKHKGKTLVNYRKDCAKTQEKMLRAIKNSWQKKTSGKHLAVKLSVQEKTVAFTVEN